VNASPVRQRLARRQLESYAAASSGAVPADGLPERGSGGVLAGYQTAGPIRLGCSQLATRDGSITRCRNPGRRIGNHFSWSGSYGSRAARWAATTGDPMQRDLVERAVGGDRDAFTELQRGSIDRLYAIARLILRDSDRAQDATQEALIAAWRGLRGLRDPDRFEAWLRRLLVTACYREARSQKRRVRAEGRVRPIETETADPARMTADRDELDRAIESLAPEQRALIVLHYHLGLPMHETAVALGLPVGTVKSRLHRTKQQMRATLEADARRPLLEGGAP
jgi:RNA polymerase sigma-70 factor, ECF subfamily